MIHFDYVAIALLSSILTAIPIVTLALIVGVNHTTNPQPRPEREPTPEPWTPIYLDGNYHWERTSDDDNDPYGWKYVRDDEEVCG